MTAALYGALTSIICAQDVFLSPNASPCDQVLQHAAVGDLIGNWAATGTGCGTGCCTLDGVVSVDEVTCEASAQFRSVPYGDVTSFTDFEAINISAELFTAMGWATPVRQVNGFRAKANVPYSNASIELVGYRDTSTNTVTSYLIDSQSGPLMWLWIPTAPAIGHSTIVEQLDPRQHRRYVFQPSDDPCRDVWPDDLWPLLQNWGGPWVVSSSNAVVEPGNCNDALTHHGLVITNSTTCEVSGWIQAQESSKVSTRTARLSNFSVVDLPAKTLNDLGISWTAGQDTFTAVSASISTEWGSGQAFAWVPRSGHLGDQYIMYCSYTDGSQEIFLWNYAN